MMICKYWHVMIALFLYTGLFAQYTKGRPYIDSLINVHDSLKLYKELTYCERLNYIDSIVDKYGDIAFYKDYFRVAIFDVCLYANVNPNTIKSDFSPVYKNEKIYREVSKNCRNKLNCKIKKVRCGLFKKR